MPRSLFSFCKTKNCRNKRESVLFLGRLSNWLKVSPILMFSVYFLLYSVPFSFEATRPSSHSNGELWEVSCRSEASPFDTCYGQAQQKNGSGQHRSWSDWQQDDRVRAGTAALPGEAQCRGKIIDFFIRFHI